MHALKNSLTLKWSWSVTELTKVYSKASWMSLKNDVYPRDWASQFQKRDMRKGESNTARLRGVFYRQFELSRYRIWSFPPPSTPIILIPSNWSFQYIHHSSLMRFFSLSISFNVFTGSSSESITNFPCPLSATEEQSKLEKEDMEQVQGNWKWGKKVQKVFSAECPVV